MLNDFSLNAVIQPGIQENKMFGFSNNKDIQSVWDSKFLTADTGHEIIWLSFGLNGFYDAIE